MKTALEHNHKTYRPDENAVLTVRELIEILSECPPDAEILVGPGLDNCEDCVERVIVSDNTVLFATEPNEPED